MARDSKLGIFILGFSIVLYVWWIPWGIEQPGVKWKPGLGVLKNVALSARLFPNLLAIGMGIIGILLIIDEVKRRRKHSSDSYSSGMKMTNTTLLTIGISIAYFFALIKLGFLYSTVPALVAFLYCFGMRSWIKIILTATITPLLLYVIIEKIMLTQLPKGILPMFF